MADLTPLWTDMNTSAFIHGWPTRHFQQTPAPAEVKASQSYKTKTNLNQNVTAAGVSTSFGGKADCLISKHRDCLQRLPQNQSSWFPQLHLLLSSTCFSLHFPSSKLWLLQDFTAGVAPCLFWVCHRTFQECTCLQHLRWANFTNPIYKSKWIL